MGQLLGWGSSDIEEREWGTYFSLLFFFFSSLSIGEDGERAAPCYQTMSAPRDGGQSFDDALESLM